MKLGVLYLGKGGGCSHCTYELARAMASVAEVTCYLAAQNVMLEEFEALPCRIHAFQMKRGSKALFVSMLTGHEESGVAKAIEADCPDIILDTGSGGWGNVVQRQLHGRFPIAQIVHDVAPHPDVRSFIDNLPGLLKPSVADVFVGLSEYSYQALRHKYPRKPCISSKHGVILPSGNIDFDTIAANRNKQLFFGRIDPYKGLDVLVEAFSLVREINPHIELDIVGRGLIKPKTMQRISSLKIGLVNRYVTDEEVRQVISSHGVMILPYISATQSGVAAVAMGNGLPCIATSVGALPEQVVHARNGLVVRPRDPQALAEAMVSIAGSPDTARKMAEESLRIGADSYSWERIGQDLIDNFKLFLRDVSI